MKTLVVFDFDDTLFYTNARIKDPIENKTYTTKEFVNYKGDMSHLDFSEFRINRLIEPVTPNKRIIKKYLKAVDQYGRNNVVIITARRLAKPIVDCLKKFNLPVVNVYTSTSDKDNSTQKMMILKNIVIKNKYAKIIIYDDSRENLNKMGSIRSNNIVSIETIIV